MVPNFDYDDAITRIPIRILLHVQYYTGLDKQNI